MPDYICKWILWMGSFVILIDAIGASRGDRDYTYLRCLRVCHQNDCFNKEFINQSLHLRLLKWDCDAECKYRCMWVTVNLFQKYNVPVPQFFGKWPFVRVLGMQEPASVVFSLLNMLSHVVGAQTLRKRVASNAPLRNVWIIFSLMGINGFFWSVLFHTRDFRLTELMDYFSAFSVNAFSLFALIYRLFYGRMGSLQPRLLIFMALALLLFCLYHCYYLVFIHFDYGYNMAANVAIGMINAAGWLTWSGFKRHSHSWKCALFVILALSALILEVFDFPPVAWTFDAHSIWHLLTAPITLIWYSFLVDDCNHMNQKLKLRHE